RAGHGDARDIPPAHGPRAVRDRAGLAGRLGRYCDVVGYAALKRGGERESAVPRYAEIVRALVLQRQRPDKPGDIAPDAERPRHAGHIDTGDARPAGDPRTVDDRAGLAA